MKAWPSISLVILTTLRLSAGDPVAAAAELKNRAVVRWSISSRTT